MRTRRFFQLLGMTSLTSLAVITAGCSSSESGATSPDQAGDAGADAAPSAHCPDGFPIRIVSGKIIVVASIAGGAPKSWVLDTGALTSLGDTSLASEAGKGPVKITFADHEATLDSLELRPLKESLRIPDVVGIIGRDVFGKGALTVDYPRGRIWLDTPRDELALLACEHVAPHPAEVDVVDDGFLYVRGKAENTDGYFLVDTGASLGAMPESVFKALNDAAPRPWLGGFYTPAMLGKFWAKLTIVDSLEVGSARVGAIATRTTPDDKLPGTTAIPQKERFLGVLPSGFLSHFMVTFDYPAKRLRLAAKKDDALIEPHTYFTTGISIAESLDPPVLVTGVLPGSDAEKKGIASGDELVSVDGQPFATMDPYARAFRLLATEAGQKITLAVKTGGQDRTVEVATSDALYRHDAD